jgi:PncC family amidohydrolase
MNPPPTPSLITLRTRAEALAEALGPALLARSATLACAESCTGGLIGALVTAVPGSSDYFLGGVIAYANAVKVGQLDVSPATLADHGAVSAATAREMAAGARARLGADYAVSVTGIAGPGGATPEKPVGLVFVGLAGPSGVTAIRHLFPGDREAVRLAAAGAALERVLEALGAVG